MKCGEYKIEIGCGNDKSEGFIGIDISENSDADIIRDIKDGLPFCDNSAEYVKAISILEHFDNDNFVKVMKEIWRVLKNKGILEIVVPDSMTDKGFKDPTHKMHFTRATFSYFEPDSPKQILYKFPPFKTIYRENINGEFLFKLEVVK